MVSYFHACEAVHPIGTRITTQGAENFYWEKLVAAGKNAANEVIEDARPRDKPSRRTCVFAAMDAGFALAFLEGQGGTPHVYEVEAVGPVHSAPMMLTTGIAKRLGSPVGAKHVAEMVALYWSGADSGWTGVEVLADELVVVREVLLSPDEAKAAATIARMGYADDSARVANAWPR